MQETNHPLVVIECLAYNEDSYIRQTLDGFVTQKTNFKFIALVHDDASDDQTASIILDYAKKYPEIIVPVIDKDNLYSKGILWIRMQKLIASYGSEYVAYCEGDDWWTDEYKLQRQVDYMEQHPNCLMCYTDCDVYYENESLFNRNIVSTNKLRPNSFIDQLFEAQYIAPMTWLVRTKYWDLNDSFSDPTYAMSLDLFAEGEVYFLQCSTAVYRVRSGSVANSVITKHWAYLKGIFDTGLYYIDKYSCGKEIELRFRAKYYLEMLPDAIQCSDQDFINEAIEFYKSHYGINLFQMICKIKELTQSQKNYYKISNSKAYKIGKKILLPLKLLKPRIHK